MLNLFFICDTPQCFRKMHTFFSNFCKCLSFDSHFLQSKAAFSLTSAKSELQKLTRVRVVDNSFYATEPYRRKPRVIAVYKPGKPGRQRAIIGDKVLVAIRGQKMKAIVVGCRQMPGPFIPRFDTNNVVLLDDKGNPCGNRITDGMGCFCGKERFSVHGRNLKVVDRIAEGGYSVVDLMVECGGGSRSRTGSSQKDLYAVKRILTRSVEDEKMVLEEIKFHRIIDHPNLIKLIDSAVVNPSSAQTEYLLILPFYKNGSLEHALKINQSRGTRFSHHKVLTILKGVCAALQYLHSHPKGAIGHRDLKCANILLGREDRPVLMDFGSMIHLPIKVTNRSQAMTLQDDAAEKCSILYRAPELFNVEVGETLTVAMDVWSLGCVLYALMYLENPFEKCFSRGDSVALAAMGRNIKIPPNSSYPGYLNDLIYILMAVEPGSRPAMETVIERIESALAATTQSELSFEIDAGGGDQSKAAPTSCSKVTRNTSGSSLPNQTSPYRDNISL